MHDKYRKIIERQAKRRVIRPSYECGCIGPQDGEPLCPCAMRARGIFKRDGRWIEPAQAERDLGPANE